MRVISINLVKGKIQSYEGYRVPQESLAFNFEQAKLYAHEMTLPEEQWCEEVQYLIDDILFYELWDYIEEVMLHSVLKPDYAGRFDPEIDAEDIKLGETMLEKYVVEKYDQFRCWIIAPDESKILWTRLEEYLVL